MIPVDYENRVYAGWLGKCIGVRFGAPLETWTYEAIRDNLGDLTTYVGEDGKIFKPDDDTSLPMMLIRALEDYGVSDAITAEQFGDLWLNYLGDQHGSLWWGGYGVSTEHTAYLNLASGIAAPRSGSIAQNGATLAEQIGGQIFSDIWGLILPNDPARAADLSERSSSVSHDGEGIYGGRFIAALVSAAFSTNDPKTLLHIGLEQIPGDSEYARVISAMLDFHQAQPEDWRAAFEHLKANFGYDRYPGVVHIIPNAGVIAIGLLYGDGDFSRTIQITNMLGWDTDCNVGNVGTILGIAVGLDGIPNYWREPMNDLLIASSMIGTRNILTIPQCADLFAGLGKQLAGEEASKRHRYHFEYPGSTSNFRAFQNNSSLFVRNARVGEEATLRCNIPRMSKKDEIRICTRTYYRPKELGSNYYEAMFSPLIYPGERVEVRVYVPEDAPDSLMASPYVYDDNHRQMHQPEGTPLTLGEWQTLTYTIPYLKDACLSEVGVTLHHLGAVWSGGTVDIVWLDWSGVPEFKQTFALEQPESSGISQWTRWRGYWRLEDGALHGSGPGSCETYSGAIRWSDYELRAEIVPLIGDYHQINVRVQGAQRSYAFGLAPEGKIRLYKKVGEYQPVAEADFAWEQGQAYTLTLSAVGDELRATVKSGEAQQSLTWRDTDSPYLSGQIGLSTQGGSHTRFLSVQVTPANAEE